MVRLRGPLALGVALAPFLGCSLLYGAGDFSENEPANAAGDAESADAWSGEGEAGDVAQGDGGPGVCANGTHAFCEDFDRGDLSQWLPSGSHAPAKIVTDVVVSPPGALLAELPASGRPETYLTGALPTPARHVRCRALVRLDAFDDSNATRYTFLLAVAGKGAGLSDYGAVLYAKTGATYVRVGWRDLDGGTGDRRLADMPLPGLGQWEEIALDIAISESGPGELSVFLKNLEVGRFALDPSTALIDRLVIGTAVENQSATTPTQVRFDDVFCDVRP